MNFTNVPLQNNKEFSGNNSFSFKENGGSSKKRKLSMDENCSPSDRIRTLEFENEALKKIVERLGKEKQSVWDGFNEQNNQLVKLEDAVTRLEAANISLQKDNEMLQSKSKAETDSLKSTIDNFAAKIKSLEDEKQASEVLFQNESQPNHENNSSGDYLLKNYSSEMQIRSLNEVFDGTKPDFSVLTCNTILRIAKLNQTIKGWNFNSASDSEKPYFIKHENMNKTCFKLFITDELKCLNCSKELRDIISKIHSCELKVLHLVEQNLIFSDYLKFVSSKRIETCILKKVVVYEKELWHDSKCKIDEILTEVPNVKEFKYEFCDGEDQAVAVENLCKLQQFSNLQNFELSNLSRSFNLHDFSDFIKKNSKDVGYVFSFSGLTNQSMKGVRKAEKKLLKCLSFPCKICVNFK